jgi:hypothetical protein
LEGLERFLTAAESDEKKSFFGGIFGDIILAEMTKTAV